MEHNSFDEYDEIFNLFDSLLIDKKESRSRKRKWREIETYKDRKRWSKFHLVQRQLYFFYVCAKSNKVLPVIR
jgi:hypothetical protein